MATKCPCVRKADREKYGAMSVACCAKQEKPVTIDDYKSLGRDILKKVLKGADKGKEKGKMKAGGSVTKWTRNNTRGRGRCM